MLRACFGVFFFDWFMRIRLLRFSRIVVAGASLSAIGCVHVSESSSQRWSRAVHDGYALIPNLEYTPVGWPQRIQGDLYVPRSGENSHAAVLLIHGGGWTGEDGRWQMNPIAKKLVKRGYVVFNVTYRMAPRWTYPAQVEDMRVALDWMRAHAEEYRIDTSRMAIYGYSAGGYLATQTVFTGDGKQSGIRAVVAGAAPADLKFYSSGDLVPQFLGGKIDEIPETFHYASPVNHVNQDSPPVFMYQGDRDRIVRPEHAWSMTHALDKGDIEYQLHWVKGRGHISTFLLPGDSVDSALDFLDGHLHP